MATQPNVLNEQQKLAIAVRKAIFTSAAITAAATFSPTTFAENAPTPVSHAQQAASSVAAAAQEKDDETVADLTNVEQQQADAIAEVTTGTDTITIVNGNNIDAGDAEVVGADEHTVVYEDTGLSNHMLRRLYGENPEFQTTGHRYTGMRKLNEYGAPEGDVIEFDGGPVELENISDYLTDNSNITVTDESLAQFSQTQVLGGRSDLSLVVAEVGDLTAVDAIGISAETEAGDIVISNTGDIKVGSGESVSYFSEIKEYTGQTHGKRIDVDGDGENDYMIWGEFSHLHSTKDMQTVDVYAKAINAITDSGNVKIDNAAHIQAGETAVGIEVTANLGDVDIHNSGDIETGEGSNGIVVNTAVQTETLKTYDYTFDLGYTYYEQAGEPGNEHYAPEQKIHEFNRFEDVEIIDSDGGDNLVVVNNTGNISVGQRGAAILVNNPSGDSSDVANSGDINIAAGVGGVGIYVNMVAGTEYYRQDLGSTNVGDPNDPSKTEICDQFDRCEYVYSEFDRFNDIKVKDYINDKGTVVVANTGNINLSETLGGAGIRVITDGDKTITNSGEIAIGGVSTGIFATGVGNNLVENSGAITLHGAGAIGINVASNPTATTSGLETANVGVLDENKEAYAGIEAGETYVINTGDIIQESDNSEFIVINENGGLVQFPKTSIGMNVSAFNANIRNSATKFAQYGWTEEQREGVDAIELYDTKVVNEGNIILDDIAVGITGAAYVGTLTIENSGYVKVGDGLLENSANTYGARWLYSGGVMANNWFMEGAAHQTIINNEEGVIITGDLGQGLGSFNWNGSNTVINKGHVEVGSGATLEIEEGIRDTENTRSSTGIMSVIAGGFNAYNEVINDGVVITGDTSTGIIGSNARTNGSLTDENFGHNYHVSITNNGDVTTGDNSVGIYGVGFRVKVDNTDTVTVGSGGIGRNGFDDLERGAVLRIAGQLVGERAEVGVIHNSGDLVGGDNIIGIDNNAVFAIGVQYTGATTTLGDNTIGINSYGFMQGYGINLGSVVTGDDSIGINAFGAVTLGSNYGSINVGADSTGIYASGIRTQILNAGEIVTGENSTGLNAIAGSQPTRISGLARVPESEDNGRYGYVWFQVNDESGDALVLTQAPSEDLVLPLPDGVTTYMLDEFLDEDGNPILNENGERQYHFYLLVNDPAITQGSIGAATVVNSGAINSQVGIHVTGQPTQPATFVDFNGREFTYAGQAVVSNVTNSGEIEAATGIVVEDVTQNLTINSGNIVANTGIDVSVVAVANGLESQLAYTEVLDDEGNPVYTTVVDDSGNVITKPMLEPVMTNLTDANGFNVYGLNGEAILVQAYEEVETEAVAAVATIANEGQITADIGIKVHVDNNGAEFTDGINSVAAIYNLGSIDADQAIVVTGDSQVVITNSGAINGMVSTGAGDDLFHNTVASDYSRAGLIQFDNSQINLGAGTNEFRNTFGDISFAGDSAILVGAEGQVNHISGTSNYVSITSVNNNANDTLTIDGDMSFTTTGSNSGILVLETSMSGNDQIIIDGDLTVERVFNQQGDTSEVTLNVGLAPAAQFKGESQHVLLSDDISDGALVTAKGEHNTKGLNISTITGDYADTVVKVDVAENAKGQEVVTLVYGLSQFGTAASSVSHLAANVWQESVNASTGGLYQEGLSGYVNTFHSDSDIAPQGEIAEQNLGFYQRLTGVNAGARYQQADWHVSILASQATADASQMQQQATSSLDLNGYTLTAGYQGFGGYIEAVAQQLKFDAAISNASATERTEGQALGLSVELGYQLEAYGFNWTPQVQLSSVQVDVDDLSHGVFDYQFDNAANTQVRAGFTVDKTFELDHGKVQPYLKLALVETVAENFVMSNDVAFLSDLSGTGHNVDVGLNSTYKGWTVNGGVGIHDGDANKNGMSLKFSTSYSF